MKKTAVITSLVICLFIGMFVSSCNNANKPILDQITAEQFEPNLKAYAEQCCEEKWGKIGKPIGGWEITSCERRGDIILVKKSDNSGKKGTAIYHVTMTGPLGMKTGSVDVTVTGMLNINRDGSVSFVKDSEGFSNIENLN